MEVIDSFLSRYKKEYDFYDQSARLAEQLLRGSLQSAGVRAIVTSRAKSLLRLSDKIRQRNEDNRYKSVDDIYTDIVDLAGVRVALYFPGEHDQVDSLIAQHFAPRCPPKKFTGTTKSKPEKRFSGYWATHYRVNLREASLNETQKRYADAAIEIQVASVLMHAWAEVEHDLVYKPTTGSLSEEELSILDELNGLVMAGEIALGRLEKAGELRVTTKSRRFENHFELAAYIIGQTSKLLSGHGIEVNLGRVDALYLLLDRYNTAEPVKLKQYMQSLSSDTEKRTISEQIVDNFIAGDKDKYEYYENIKHKLGFGIIGTIRDESNIPDDLRRHGDENHIKQDVYIIFMSKWIQFEQMLRTIVFSGKDMPQRPIFAPAYLKRAGFGHNEIGIVDRIRRIRNNIVHGLDVPGERTIVEASMSLDKIIHLLKKKL